MPSGGIHHLRNTSSLLPCFSVTSPANSKKPGFTPNSICLIVAFHCICLVFSEMTAHTAMANSCRAKRPFFIPFALCLRLHSFPKSLRSECFPTILLTASYICNTVRLFCHVLHSSLVLQNHAYKRSIQSAGHTMGMDIVSDYVLPLLRNYHLFNFGLKKILLFEKTIKIFLSFPITICVRLGFFVFFNQNNILQFSECKRCENLGVFN